MYRVDTGINADACGRLGNSPVESLPIGRISTMNGNGWFSAVSITVQVCYNDPGPLFTAFPLLALNLPAELHLVECIGVFFAHMLEQGCG